jgi:hypothetical protein
MISAASAYAHTGIERAFADAARAAKNVMQGFTPDEAGDSTLRDDQVVRALMDLNRAKHALNANAAVLRTDQRMTGTLLDILA